MKQNLLISIAIALLYSVTLNPLLSQDNITDTKTMSVEDWETGDFSQYEWQFAGNAEWFITDQNPYEGIFCAQSGDIEDGQTTFLTLNYDVYAEDTLSFWFKVSSEIHWDFLKFFVDNVGLDSWSGEVPWQQASYMISAGSHSFTWIYYKNLSGSNGADACRIDYIVFPQMEIEAHFTADTTVICKNDVAHFFDQSGGPVTGWNWIFEGAIPSSSTIQNPVVTYPNEGEWDVFLEVSDGTDTAQLYMSDFMTVGNVPAPAPTPTGISFLCASWGNTSYNTIGLPGITQYNWIIDPPEAGTISGAGSNVTVIWEEDFLGEVDLMVAGINYCGIGVYSDPLTITRYLPDVSVMLPAFVALSTPPFELTGGLPVGGEYTGPGVTNNVFDPAAAGLGTHTITYTYTDINLCTNSAIDSITVTPYTGVIHQDGQRTVNIYPNPTYGSFRVQLYSEETDFVNIKIYNSLIELVWEMNNVIIHNKLTQMIQLENHPPGIYYLQVNGEKIHSSHKVIFME
ncbi:MAG: T9SS type A sorting domain-containing protein [Bacteroidales bacterium]|nr:T9SS type A sorting domain-containing protein [Bacteroidales bacterium]